MVEPYNLRLAICIVPWANRWARWWPQSPAGACCSPTAAAPGSPARHDRVGSPTPARRGGTGTRVWLCVSDLEPRWLWCSLWLMAPG